MLVYMAGLAWSGVKVLPVGAAVDEEASRSGRDEAILPFQRSHLQIEEVT